MYEMMTGRVPFGGPSNVRILTAHLNESAPPMQQLRDAPGPSPHLEEVVRRCIEKDRERRFRSMAEVLAALDRTTAPTVTYTPAIWVGDCGDALERESSTVVRPLSVAANRGGLLCPAMTGGAALLLIAAFVASAAQRSGASSVGLRLVIDPAPLPAASPASPEDDAEAATHAQDATIEVIADPPATSVKEGDAELCRATPCAILYDGPGNTPERAHVLTIAREGYRSETRRVTAADGPVRVILTPVPSAIQHATPQSPKAGVPMLLSGYRLDIPY
jgi:serine/threonine-protein kinase